MQEPSWQFPESARVLKSMYLVTLYLGMFLLPTTRKPIIYGFINVTVISTPCTTVHFHITYNVRFELHIK
jgi:hypothetical protein